MVVRAKRQDTTPKQEDTWLIQLKLQENQLITETSHWF
ncbi:hypothetical protein SynPROS71_01487 [Synechococcus sp. PROS-7-1]|nr:hypothetical protein SynPROS71_01487 [Synechococcus sp. PROS-7-1]